MTDRFLFLPVASICLSLFLVVGCQKNDAPAALPADQVPQVVEQAFKSASAEAKTNADEVVASLQNKDDVKAFVDLQILGARTDLTPGQREAATRSMLSLNERLRDAAAQGDQKAQEALQQYHAHK